MTIFGFWISVGILKFYLKRGIKQERKFEVSCELRVVGCEFKRITALAGGILLVLGGIRDIKGLRFGAFWAQYLPFK